ncbi:MAG: TMEM165/GDT1 family protein [Candidatus Brockarchaeota archaeon]|nr:TMEM165/GDT1 family protein [Candidatus Brockarchaeota archaeon]
MDLTPLLASFLLVVVAELGDKTQIAIITLSSHHNALLVFTGGILALLLVSGLGVVIGGTLATVIPLPVIRVASAVLFLAFGVYTILSAGKKEEQVERLGLKSVALLVFSMVTLMELGDKTQLAVVALTAEYGSPLLVYAGVAMAFTIITGLGVLIGSRFLRLVSLRRVKLGSGVVFILFGMFCLVNAVFPGFLSA